MFAIRWNNGGNAIVARGFESFSAAMTSLTQELRAIHGDDYAAELAEYSIIIDA